METSLVLWGYIRGYRDHGKENGKEDGNYYAFSGRSCFHRIYEDPNIIPIIPYSHDY